MKKTGFSEWRKESDQELLSQLTENAQAELYEAYSRQYINDADFLRLSRGVSHIKTLKDLEAFQKAKDSTGISQFYQLEEFEEQMKKAHELSLFFVNSKEELTSANWQETLKVIINQFSLPYRDVFYEIVLKSYSAQILELAFEKSRLDGMTTQEFAHALIEALKLIQPLPLWMVVSGDVQSGKRHPSFLESIEGTLERFTVLEKLPEIFKDHVESIIIGGSMSYGPFFNIRKNLDKTGSSDIDVIFVLKQTPLDEDAWLSFLESSVFNDADKKQLVARVPIFNDLYEANVADVFSQKLRCEGYDFLMSAHFFPLEKLDHLINSDLERSLKSGSDVVNVVKDYKQSPFEREVCVQYGFDGSTSEYTVPEQKEVDAGIITELPGFDVKDGKLYPGLYHNLISPSFNAYYDSTGTTTQLIKKFERLIHEEVSKEKELSPNSNVYNSHLRQTLFAARKYI